MDAAVDKAVLVFRERGYHGTSITDLKDAMALASGSIYKAFKDKQAVFLAALDRYLSTRNEQIAERLARVETGRDRLRALLDFYIETAHGQEGRRGCLVVGSAVEMAVLDPEIAARVSEAVVKNETRIATLIAQGQADGSISQHIDRDAVARVMLCVIQGIRVVGKTGQSRKAIASVAETTMKLLG